MFKLPTTLFPEWPIAVPRELPAVLPAGLVDATRSFAESQLAGCSAFVRAAFESSASLVELNVHAARDGIDAVGTVSNQLLFVREPRDLVCLTASQSQQALERAQRYGRQVAGVANQANHRLSELSRDFAGSLSRNPIE
jgi:phasin family protein